MLLHRCCLNNSSVTGTLLGSVCDPAVANGRWYSTYILKWKSWPSTLSKSLGCYPATPFLESLHETDVEHLTKHRHDQKEMLLSGYIACAPVATWSPYIHMTGFQSVRGPETKPHYIKAWYLSSSSMWFRPEQPNYGSSWLQHISSLGKPDKYLKKYSGLHPCHLPVDGFTSFSYIYVLTTWWWGWLNRLKACTMAVDYTEKARCRLICWCLQHSSTQMWSYFSYALPSLWS